MEVSTEDGAWRSVQQNQAVVGSLSRLLEIFDHLLSMGPHSIFLHSGVTQPTPPSEQPTLQNCFEKAAVNQSNSTLACWWIGVVFQLLPLLSSGEEEKDARDHTQKYLDKGYDTLTVGKHLQELQCAPKLLRHLSNRSTILTPSPRFNVGKMRKNP